MKSFVYLLFAAIILMPDRSLFSQASSNLQQALSINPDGAAPAASAMLDVQSTDKGVLVPRMTTAQRTAIAAPAAGLLVYDADAKNFWFYNGTAWVNLAAPALLADADGDTKIQVEESPDEDVIRFDIGGTEGMVLIKNAGGSSRLELPNSLNNTFAGLNAGAGNTSGLDNTAFGSEALKENTTGNFNAAHGTAALANNTTGAMNSAYGTGALHYSVSGDFNTATGLNALFYNTTGSVNTAVGMNALFFNKANSRSTAVGRGAMIYADNRTTGRETFNTAIGYEALRGSTAPGNNTGRYNTAIGDQALLSNSNGESNTASGAAALNSNTSGDSNTASGAAALNSNTSGSSNTASGFNALHGNLSGNRNTAIGTGTLSVNSDGDSNTAVGLNAGDQGTSLSQCTSIGAISDVGTSSNSYANATAIGYDANVAANNYVRIGNPSVTSIGGQVGWSNYSDGRFKRQVREDVAGLDFITRLRPVTYQWDIHAMNQFIPNSDEDSTGWAGKYDIEMLRFTGFIAQEVEAAAKQAGFDFSGLDKPQNEHTPYALRYAEFVVPLVKAVQEQQEHIEQQNARIDSLQEQQAALQSRFNALLSRLEGIEAAGGN